MDDYDNNDQPSGCSNGTFDPIAVDSQAIQMILEADKKKVNGIQVTNANINVNVDKKGGIVSYGENIFRGARPKDKHLNNTGRCAC
ncbi:unnamed protein product [Rotaria sordida]|uniref:Uncharacterized protein n=1 Tax=Rotaria sordida TaxID=392033 RepID=A0A815E4V9_9BILA|nr:unnamed protein product [Rotaria sordida]